MEEKYFEDLSKQEDKKWSIIWPVLAGPKKKSKFFMMNDLLKILVLSPSSLCFNNIIDPSWHAGNEILTNLRSNFIPSAFNSFPKLQHSFWWVVEFVQLSFHF